MHKKIKLTRSELYTLVWEHPITYFTEKYMVSYASLKRICERNEIPLPPNGYWSKKKYGRENDRLGLNSIDKESNIALFLQPE